MKKSQVQIRRDSELKEKELIGAIERLNDNPDFITYMGLLGELKEIIKNECIKAGDIERVRGYQAQYALLESIWKHGQLPEERDPEE